MATATTSNLDRTKSASLPWEPALRWPWTRPWRGWPEEDALKAELVKLRFFAGLTVEQTAATWESRCNRQSPLGLRQGWLYAGCIG